MTHSGPPNDPLDLDRVDQQIRINELEAKLEGMGLESMGVADECSADLHEDFLGSVLAYESAPISSQFERLTKDGVELPSPDSLDDAALHAKLWEVINALAAYDVYLVHTDHLSDRGLYEHLWHGSLREEYPMMPAGSGWINHIDILGGCSEEDIEIGLRYYDSEESRKHWAEEYPQDVIPPHEDPPYQRDKLLPQPPAPCVDDAMDEDDDEDDGDQDWRGGDHPD